MLVDDPTACSPLACNDTLPFYGATGSALAGIEKIDSWAFSREIATGQVALTSYDFERPSVSLAASSALERSHGLAALEEFDFDGSYTTLVGVPASADLLVASWKSALRRLALLAHSPSHGLLSSVSSSSDWSLWHRSSSIALAVRRASRWISSMFVPALAGYTSKSLQR